MPNRRTRDSDGVNVPISTTKYHDDIGVGGSGVTKGKFAICSPKTAIESTTTEPNSFFGASNNSVSYVVPFAGTIKKVIINTRPEGSSDIGNGTIQISKYPAGESPRELLGMLTLVPSYGEQSWDVDYPFDAGDGFRWVTQSNGVGASYTLSLEIQYDLV